VALEELQHNFLTDRWRTSSLGPSRLGVAGVVRLACCAIEMMATGGADFDIARYGMEVFRNSPRQATS